MRTYPLPEFTIHAHQSANVSTGLPTVDGPFKPTWFHIPENVARHLLITDIKVGRNSQLISTTCLPASIFSSNRTEKLHTETLLPNRMYITLSITNTSSEAVDFSGEVIGNEPPNNREDELYVLGLGHILVKENLALSVQSQVPMSPALLYVPETIIEEVEIENVVVRPYTHSYQISSGDVVETDCPFVSGVPTKMLLNNHQSYRSILLEPKNLLNASDFLVLKIHNKSKNPLYFTGAILGHPEKKKP